MLDIDGYNAGLSSGGIFDGAPPYIDSRTILFTVDNDGFPIFTPTNTFDIDPNFAGDVIGRFRVLNTYNEYVNIYQVDASGAFAVGDPIYYNRSTNKFAKSYGLGDVSGVTLSLGVITSVGVPTKDYFTFNPFGEYRAQTSLTGPAGTVYYINPTGTTGANAYTTNRPPLNPYPVYQLLDGTGTALLLKGQNLGTAGGDRYLTATTSAITPTVTEGGSQTLPVGTGLSYIPGNSVAVINASTPTVRFEGAVQSYNASTGQMVLQNVTNIKGPFTLSVYNVNLDGVDGPTGATGATGATGWTGPTGVAGNIYNTATVTPALPTPVTGGSQTFTVATGLAYITGNTVVVVDSTNAANTFQGRVQTYTAGTGAIVIDQITNIAGTFTSQIYNVNLNGISGPTGSTGATG
jgi:hypothetical protein